MVRQSISMSQNPRDENQRLINKINDGSILLTDLTVEKCHKLDSGKVLPEKLKEVYKRMVDEVFKRVGIYKADARACLNTCVLRLIHGKPLQASTMGEYKGRKAARKYLQTVLQLQDQTAMPGCIPAPFLVSMVVALTIRQVRIETNKFMRENQSFYSQAKVLAASQLYNRLATKHFALKRSARASIYANLSPTP
ncbi:hypothetical protein IL306_007497 [Fusarium sp. DS 682]|nr:hypothetical protein IL306_007497 [Fusarium sp. DS 682]